MAQHRWPDWRTAMLMDACTPHEERCHTWGCVRYNAKEHHVHTLSLCQLPEPGTVRSHERLAPCKACQVGASESGNAFSSPGPGPALVYRAARSTLLPAFCLERCRTAGGERGYPGGPG